jgi:hypothetical protein
MAKQYNSNKFFVKKIMSRIKEIKRKQPSNLEQLLEEISLRGDFQSLE